MRHLKIYDADDLANAVGRHPFMFEILHINDYGDLAFNEAMLTQKALAIHHAGGFELITNKIDHDLFKAFVGDYDTYQNAIAALSDAADVEKFVFCVDGGNADFYFVFQSNQLYTLGKKLKELAAE